MIAATADPNGPTNMIATGLFWTVGICLLIGIGKAIDTFEKARSIRRHVSRALDNGDTRLGDAADAMWAARNRPSIPRQLEGTRRP